MITPAEAPKTPAEDLRPRIAVLPFRLLGDAGPHYVIAEALPQDLITALSRLHWMPEEAAMLKFKVAGAIAAFAAVGLAGCAESATETAAAAAPVAATAPVTHLAEDPALQWGPCPEIFPGGCEIAVLNGNPAQPNADVFLRAPGGGYHLAAHSHTSAERMVLVRGELNVHYQGAEPATLTAGEYAYGPAGLPHDATCVSAEPCVLFIAFEGPIDAMAFDAAIE